MVKNFLESTKGLSRNPLGIIALFIALIYGLAVILLTFSGDNLSEAQKWPDIWFVVLFPLVVIYTFYQLVTKHHSKLYSPSDFRDEGSFLRTLPLDHQRAKLETELSTPTPLESDVVETQDEDVDEAEVSESIAAGTKWDKNDHLLAEDLSIRQIEREIGDSLIRHSVLKDRIDLAFDGATYKERTFYLVEVKLLSKSTFPKDIIDALISRRKEAERFVYEDFDDRSTNVILIIVIVVDLPEDEMLVLENKFRSYVKRNSSNIETRVFQFDQLKREYLESGDV